MKCLRNILLVLVLAIGTGGCAWSLGGESEKHEHLDRPTIGHELTDLKEALDKGAISKEEYDELKQKLKEAADRR